MIEIIGTIASIILLIAITFNTDTKKHKLLLRGLNIIGSSVYIVYGILKMAYSIIGFNIITIIICVYHFIVVLRGE